MQRPYDRTTRRRQNTSGGRALLAGAICLLAAGCGTTSANNHAAIDRPPPQEIARSAGDAAFLLRAARERSEAGDAIAARAAAEAACQVDPNSTRVQNSAGKLLLEIEAEQDGIAALARAVELALAEAAPARDLAAAFVGRGDGEAARRVLLDARRRLPRDPSLAVALARLEDSAGNWQRAVDAYDAVLAHDSGDRLSRKQRARCHYRLGNFHLACRDFGRCLDRSGEGLSLSENTLYGDACLRTGDLETAQARFEHVARTSPSRLREVELLRGLCALRSGRHAQAREILEAANRLWPDDPQVAALLARAADPPPRSGPSITPHRPGGRAPQGAADARIVPAGHASTSHLPLADPIDALSEGWRPTSRPATQDYPVITPADRGAPSPRPFRSRDSRVSR